MLQLQKWISLHFLETGQPQQPFHPDFILQRSEQVITYRTSKTALKEMIDDNPYLKFNSKFELNLD